LNESDFEHVKLKLKHIDIVLFDTELDKQIDDSFQSYDDQEPIIFPKMTK
jgi:hypothetical protein